MKKKLEVIPEYPMLKSNYMFLSKKIDEHVLSAKEKYDEAIETLNYYIKNKKSGNNSKQSNLFLKEKNNVLNYLNLCVWLELFNDARRTEISQELNKFYDL